jgi:hypothetical protein
MKARLLPFAGHRPQRLQLRAIATAAAVAAAAILVPASPAAADSGDGGTLFAPLAGDVIRYVPPPYQASFLVRIDAAARAWTLGILPPSRILPPSPIEPAACAASMLLTGLAAEADGLHAAGLLSQAGAGAITTDISGLQQLLIPTEPCLPPNPISAGAAGARTAL